MALRSEGRFRWVQMDGEWSYHPRKWGTGSLLEGGAHWDLLEGEVTIIATGLTGKESARDLQRLDEVFEVRAALQWEAGSHPGFWRYFVGDVMLGGFIGGINNGLQFWAKRLHAAGWRPGMTAEDAASLLAEADDLDIKEDKPHKDIGKGRAVRTVKVSK